MTSNENKAIPQTLLSKAENKFLRLCEEYPDGLPDHILQSRLENIPIETRAELINSLLGRGRLVLLQQGTEILYKIVSAEISEKFSGLDHEGVLIFRLIEQSHDRGIWIRDLRAKSGLNQVTVAKLVKTLIQKRFIKEIKSIQNNRKVYLKFDVEPSRELTGGALSFGADLDDEFVKVLRRACLSYIEKHGSASADDLGAFISSSRISNVQLESSDVLQVINSLLYDMTIEKIPGHCQSVTFPSSGTKRKRDDQLYRLSRSGPVTSMYAHIPCSVCVVAHACVQDGRISPTSCQYYTQWLDF